MNELCLILATSGLTILGGVIVFVLQNLVQGWLLEPLKELSSVRGQIQHDIVFYGNAAAGVDKVKKKAALQFRSDAALLLKSIYCIPFSMYTLPIFAFRRRSRYIEAHKALIGLSNFILEANHDEVGKAKERITSNLGLISKESP